MSKKTFQNTIFLFHVINDPSWFENTILFIKNYFDIVQIDELIEKTQFNIQTRGLCSLTFDDGDSSLYYNALSIIKKHSIPVTIFVSPSRIINRKNFWFQRIGELSKVDFRCFIEQKIGVKAGILESFSLYSICKMFKIETTENLITEYCKERGIESKEYFLIDLEQFCEMAKSEFITFGSHTMNHPILANEDFKTVEHEILQSVSLLDQLVGKKTQFFAYPNGIPGLDYSEREKNILLKAGISAAFSTRIAHYHSNDDILELPRIGLKHGNKFHILMKLILGSSWEKVRPSQLEVNDRSKLKEILSSRHVC